MSLHSIRTALMDLACGFCSAADPSSFKVELFEDCTGQDLVMNGLRPALSWESPTLALGALPGKLSLAGMTMHRAQPFAVRLQGQTNFASGEYEFQLRSRMKERFYLDDQSVLSSEVVKETPLTPQQIAAQQAEEKKTRDEAATQQAEQDARESALLRRLEDPTTAPSEASPQAVQAELDKVRQAGENPILNRPLLCRQLPKSGL